MKVIWSPLALERVNEIAAVIGRDRPQAAATWVEKIFAVVDRLECFPESGREVPEVRRVDVREVIHERYRIIYRLEAERIAVLTVRHSRQLTGPGDLPAG